MTRSKSTKTAIRISIGNKRKSAILIVSIGFALGVSVAPGVVQAKSDKEGYELTYLEEMGKRLFFANISSPKRQACASCHNPGAGGTNGQSHTNLTQVAVTGADPHTVGNRKPPTNKYAAFLKGDDVMGLSTFGPCRSIAGVCGGAFWDGRALGGDLMDSQNRAINVFFGLKNDFDYHKMYNKYVNNPVTHQAHASPFINPVEQGLANKTETCQLVQKTKWGAELYEYAWGVKLDCNKDIDIVFARFATALGAWQLSGENNNFTSKRDDVMRKTAEFTDLEQQGQDLFYGAAGCAICHRSSESAEVAKQNLLERYTDDSYHKVGFPVNYDNPGSAESDQGLFAVTGFINEENPLRSHMGMHKTPTLRNVDQRLSKNFVKAYTHNGFFKTLEGLVHFYNTGAIKERCPTNKVTEKEALEMDCWPEPEFFEGSLIQLSGSIPVPVGLPGKLGLDEQQEAALVAYLKTFTDSEIVEVPKPYKSSPERDPNRVK
ncbi:cytochrome c peroxidase [Photobacterium sp. MCCC 1A19761]|uniref:cytochrome-c peroxidase n=1 Tax=Photobacterium sp. MCCC 1A19761 TaxID=3115000 RepID=UPI00307D4B74